MTQFTIPVDERPTAAMLLYPGLTLLDLIAPHTAFAPVMDVRLVWKSLDPVTSDSGVRLHPTTTFEQCPADVDVLFVPGGLEQAAVADDDEVLAFLADRGSRARHVTAVCGGSLILGAAGLLRGKRATTHWSGRHILPLFGAEPVDERVVVDGDVITGGGVTAGLDFGLTVLARMFGDDVARLTQLAMEYDPAPPFDAGSPATAPAHLVDAARAATHGTNEAMVAVAARLAAAV